ncbi:MAG: endonuclease/exonuclease/phosphatase family protein [Deltaproteobacteria bacterium]|nr:endonuclease/exonuclease/phosphatase family protein [Deltaproteobacteria bacterium]
MQSTLATDATLSAADVLLLTEVARQDLGSNPAGIDQARDLAQALAMDYVFAVEWDRRNIPGKEGEHGVAILSKYPIGNVVVLRHVPVFDWYGEDGRLGGRMTLAADLRVGAELLRVYASHLDNRPYDPVASQDGRNLQGAEIRADAAAPERPAQVVVGGDLNTWVCNPTYFPYPDCTQAPDAEPVVQAFVAQWLDGTAGYNGHTYEESVVVRQRLDWLFLRGLARTAGGVVAGAAGSDHLPLYVDVQR